MNISQEQFEKYTQEAIDKLPEDYLKKTNNVAFIVSDYPTLEQKNKIKLKPGYVLFGLYEGYYQSSRRNVGPVLPDRITIFKQAILDEYKTEEAVRQKIFETIKHEIAHHFGSDEIGAGKAGKRQL